MKKLSVERPSPQFFLQGQFMINPMIVDFVLETNKYVLALEKRIEELENKK